MNKKLAFIDHSFHKKTECTEKLIEILKKYFDVDVYWDESWNGGSSVDLKNVNNKNYDIAIFFQIIYRVDEINALKIGNIIIIPMYDGVFTFENSFWLQYCNLKFINFSKTLHLKLQKLGLTTKYFQYYIPPADRVPPELNLRCGFFWQRTNQLTWNTIKNVIEEGEFEKIYLHGAVDPGNDFEKPSPRDMERYHISISHWFPRRQDYFSIVESANIYFAPRLYEGIGMSFLEAMAMGKCVVAPDRPTMNEYIQHDITGLLYDPENPKPLNFSNAKNIGISAKKKIANGYKNWVAQERVFIEYISEEMKVDFFSKINAIYWRVVNKYKTYFIFGLIRGKKKKTW